MTGQASRPPARIDRRWWALAIAALIGWSAWSAGLNPSEVVNERGWTQVSKFFAAMFRPDLSSTMVQLAVQEAGVTLAYALLGSALAIAIGLVGGVILTERVWSPQHGPMGRGRAGWVASRMAFAIPRSMHEVVFGLILVNILGLNPLVAVLALGIPYGAVTAKVYAEILDEVPLDTERALRASGAGRVTAIVFGTMPKASSDLLSYGFYRFECALRGAAILGIIGAGGLGFQLALSFQSLRYEQMWTLLWALILLSGLADRWSSAVRRRRDGRHRGVVAVEAGLNHAEMANVSAMTENTPTGDPFVRFSALICTLALPVAWWWLQIDITTLWNQRARTLTRELIADAWPPQIGVGGLTELISDSLSTIALAVLALSLSFLVASPLAFAASRPMQKTRSLPNLLRRALAMLLRFVFLIWRSVPPPVWAFVVVFVLFPGLWPGAVALAIYNAGVLGRLQGEVIENHDARPGAQLRATGATPSGAALLSTIPAVSERFAGLGLYRWEVMIRETVIVGVVGAAGLGRRLDLQTSSFNYDGILATIIALFVVTLAVDFTSAAIRRSLR